MMLRRLGRDHAQVRRLLKEWRFASVTGSVMTPPAPRSTDGRPLATRTLHTTNNNDLETKGAVTFGSPWRHFATALSQQKEDGDEDESVRNGGSRTPGQRMSRLLRDGRWEKALEVFEEMRKTEDKLDTRSYTAAMKACSRHGDHKKVAQLFEELKDSSTELDKFAFNTYIYSFTNTGDIKSAAKAFKMMKDEYQIPADAVTYRSLISVSGSAGDLERAEAYFNEVTELFGKDVRNYNCLIDAHGNAVTPKTGEAYYNKAKQVIEKLKDDGLKPDDHTHAHLIRLCCRAGMLTEAMAEMEVMKSDGHLPRLALVDTLAACIGEATESDEELSTALMAIYRNLPEQKMKPSELTYENIINLYSKRGNLRGALGFLDAMHETDFSKTGTYYGAKIKCIERMGTEGIIEPAESLKQLSEVVAESEKASLSLGTFGFAAWLNIAAQASDVEEAKKCWTKAATGSRTAAREVIDSALKLYLKHDAVDDGVSIFQYLKDHHLTPSLIECNLMFEYLKDKGDQESMEKVYKTVNASGSDLDKKTKAYLNTLGLE